MSKRTLIALIVLAVIIFVSAGFLFATGIWSWPFKKQAGENTQGVEEPKMTAIDANSLALQKALEWNNDAKLFSVASMPGKTGATNGNSYDWDMIFVSAAVKNEALKIEIRSGQISSTSVIPFSGKGAELPGQSQLITSEEAIGKVHQIKGYENAIIVSTELIYDPSGKWYWGIKTSKGVSLSIRADK